MNQFRAGHDPHHDFLSHSRGGAFVKNMLRQSTRPTRARGNLMRRGSVAVALAAILLATATSCTPEQSAPTPPAVSTTPPNSAAPATEPLRPSPPATRATMSPLRGDAIARSTLADGEISSTTLGAAEEGVEYVVLTACDGDPEQVLGFGVTVDDVEAASGTWMCGGDVIDTVLNPAKGGETVSVQLQAPEGLPTGTFSATVEVVPVPWGD